MKGSVRGLVLTKAVLETSQSGKSYSKISLRISSRTGEDLLECLAFNETAEELCKLTDPGVSIICSGRVGKDGTFFIASFIVPQHGSAVQDRAKNYRPIPPPRLEVDSLMDTLGAVYVERRIRSFTASTPQNMLVQKKTYSGFTRPGVSFDLEGFKKLMAELREEAEQVKARESSVLEQDKNGTISIPD